jgi:hypothetical protein
LSSLASSITCLFVALLMSLMVIYTEATVPFVPISNFGSFTYFNFGSTSPGELEDEDLLVRSFGLFVKKP